MHTPKPNDGDFLEYFKRYIDLVPEGDLVQMLEAQKIEVLALYGSITESQSLFRYQAGKWSIKEVLGHITDTERIMSYRLLCVARGDTTALPGFNQDIYVNGAHFDSRPLADLINDFDVVRASTIALMQGLTQEQLSRTGQVNNAKTTAVALAYITIGHPMYHIVQIHERYLPYIK